MISPEDHLVHHNLLDGPSVEVAPFQTIHSCLEHIWQQLHLRARLFIHKGEELILKDYVGTYGCCPEIGLKVHPGSVVWEVFRKGKAVNLTEVNKQEKRPRTLLEPVALKAVVPLTVLDSSNGEQQTVGALVVDAADSPEPIQDRDFHYLQVVGMLISEILERSVLLERIHQVQREKDGMAREVAHIVRNRFTAIGGFARRLEKDLRDSGARRWAEIILDEVLKGVDATEKWLAAHEGMGDEP